MNHSPSDRAPKPLIPAALLLVSLLLGVAVPLSRGAPGDAPSDREVGKLVEEYLELDGTTEVGGERRGEILTRLDLLDPLSESKVRSWRKKIAKLWSKGPKLEKKSGRRFLWEKEEKGLYILGGETRRPKGLFIGMHGGGRGSGDAWSSHGAYNSAVSKEGWLAIFPQVLVKTECGWTDSGTEEFILELVERALRTWKIDRNRVFFGGHSMGGYGSWTLGAHHADLVAGLVPSAGAPTPYYDGGKVVDIAEGVVPNLRNTAIVIYQSDDDPQVPPDANQMAVKKLEEAKERWGGFDFEYWEVTGYGHDAPPGGYGAHLEKIRDKVRTPRPDKIVWEQALPWKRQFYWLWCERPKASRLIVAELDREQNEVRITCPGDHGGLHVLVDDDLIDPKREFVVFLNDAEVFRGEPTLSLSALLSTGAEGDPERTYPARIALGD
jgi:hypothetical protein